MWKLYWACCIFNSQEFFLCENLSDEHDDLGEGAVVSAVKSARTIEVSQCPDFLDEDQFEELHQWFDPQEIN